MPDAVLAARAIELIQRQRRVRSAVRSAMAFFAGLALGVLAKSVFLTL
jgi:uncharacterized protein YqgC (DUF456 family)